MTDIEPMPTVTDILAEIADARHAEGVAPPSVTLEIDHGGVDGIRGVRTRENLRMLVRTAALVEGRHRKAWPHPECVRDAAIAIVARKTASVGDETVAIIREELGRWLYAGTSAATVAPVQIEKVGPAKRIIITVTAIGVTEYVDPATAARNAAYAAEPPRIDDHGHLPNVLRPGEIPAREIAPPAYARVDDRGRPIVTLPPVDTTLADEPAHAAHDPDDCSIDECGTCNRIDEHALRPDITIPPGSSRSRSIKRAPKGMSSTEIAQMRDASIHG